MAPLAIDRSGGDVVLYEPSRVSGPTDLLFDPDYWREIGEARKAEDGRGGTYFVRHSEWAADGEEWVLRRYLRGGFVARFVRERYLYLGLSRTRPVRELRLLARLHELDLPAPPPVAARVRRLGPVYQGDLLTVRVPGSPLSEAVRSGRPEPLVWCRVGEVIRRFHDAGVHHADLNLDNVLVTGAGEVHLIDFDRGSIREGDGGWKAATLARLRRSLEKERVPGREEWTECWAALEGGYAA